MHYIALNLKTDSSSTGMTDFYMQKGHNPYLNLTFSHKNGNSYNKVT